MGFRTSFQDIEIPAGVTVSTFNEHGMTQVTFKHEANRRKAWITHFRGTRTWSVSHSDISDLKAIYTVSNLSRADATEAAIDRCLFR